MFDIIILYYLNLLSVQTFNLNFISKKKLLLFTGKKMIENSNKKKIKLFNFYISQRRFCNFLFRAHQNLFTYVYSFSSY